jgi:hypothetical protein
MCRDEAILQLRKSGETSQADKEKSAKQSEELIQGKIMKK